MQDSEILELIAELAVAVLGFSGVVAVLGRLRSEEWSFVDSRRFFGMVGLSIFVLFMALLPFPFRHAGLSSSATWAWCSGIAAVTSLVLAFASLPASRPKMFKAFWRDSDVSRPALLYLVFAQWVGPLILVINAAGVGLHRSFTPYLVALLLHFSVALLLFVRLLQTALGQGRRAA